MILNFTFQSPNPTHRWGKQHKRPSIQKTA
jgi:hypothetical protein